MPRILELRKIDGEVWAKLQFDRNTEKANPPPVYIWTEQEAKDAKASAIRDFCFDLANAYIEDPTKGVQIEQ